MVAVLSGHGIRLPRNGDEQRRGAAHLFDDLHRFGFERRETRLHRRNVLDARSILLEHLHTIRRRKHTTKEITMRLFREELTRSYSRLIRVRIGYAAHSQRALRKF